MATNDLKAPFNFVPISSKVFFPDWADRISQDIPFSDGVSGYVDIDITAQSPIFIRNGHSAAEHDDDSTKSFNRTSDGRFFIPGSSIKGVIRNVLEIMSFSKITVDRDAMFAQREWDNDDLYPIKKNQASIRCGYLRQKYENESGKVVFELEDHGKPMRIGFDEIDKYLGSDLFKKHFSEKPTDDINSGCRIYDDKQYNPKTASFKYALFGDKPLRVLRFSESDRSTENTIRLKVDSLGSIIGDIVLTGQPDKCKWDRPDKMDPTAGKFYEFVFSSKIWKSYSLNEETFRHFEFIYSKSSEWERCRKLLDREGLPVFFRTDGDSIKDFGLAYLYKIPYDYSPYETLPESHKTDKPDLAECIFGRISKHDSFKGRVHFGNAFIQNSEQDSQEDELKLSLGTPKASYYPIYIQQEEGQYLTYNDGRLSGWKRYHIRKGTWQPQYSENDLLDSSIRPLKAGTVFKCRMTFHNLRPVEIGALLSAITFHNTSGCYHQIGQAKSYGLGKVRMDIDSAGLGDLDQISLMTKFEDAMESFGISNWANTEQITELFTLCHEQVDAKDEFYHYLKMSNNTGENEFVKMKSKEFRNFLHRYTHKINYKFHPISLFGQARVTMKNNECILLDLAKSLFNEGNFDSAILKYQEAEKIGLHKFTEEIDDCQREINIGIVDKLEKTANELSHSGQLKEALAKYQEADSYGIKSFATTIQRITETLDKSSIPFDQLISNISSLPALTNTLTVRIKISGCITDDELELVSQRLKNKVSSLNPREQKEWLKWGKKWDDMNKKLGREYAKRLFDSLT